VRRARRHSTDLNIETTQPDDGESAVRVAILMVHDQELVAESVGMALGAEPGLDVVAVDVSPTTGPVRILMAGADVVVVDSIPLVEVLRGGSSGLRVLVLGSDRDPGVVLSCIRAGAAGCVSRNLSPSALADAIKRVHASQVVYESSTLMALLQRPHTALTRAPLKTASLSNREIEVLRVLATGARMTEAAWHLNISLNTLRTHLKNILVKLEARSKLEAVLIALREGCIDLPLEAP
jgi:DNA-binding NarL/FixJ family response regulator